MSNYPLRLPGTLMDDARGMAKAQGVSPAAMRPRRGRCWLWRLIGRRWRETNCRLEVGRRIFISASPSGRLRGRRWRVRALHRDANGRA